MEHCGIADRTVVSRIVTYLNIKDKMQSHTVEQIRALPLDKFTWLCEQYGNVTHPRATTLAELGVLIVERVDWETNGRFFRILQMTESQPQRLKRFILHRTPMFEGQTCHKHAPKIISLCKSYTWSKFWIWMGCNLDDMIVIDD